MSLLDIAKGLNKEGQSLIGQDLVVEIEQQAFGLNDRSQTKTITVPRNEFMSVHASETSKKVAASLGKDLDFGFQRKLEARISWLKLVADEATLLEALFCQI